MTEQTEQFIELANLGNGAAAEKFQEQLDRVLENIGDPNTEATAERTITMKVKVKPAEDRRSAGLLIEASAKLAAHKPAASIVWFGQTNQGRRVAVESNPQQLAFDDGSERPKPQAVEGA